MVCVCVYVCVCVCVRACVCVCVYMCVCVKAETLHSPCMNVSLKYVVCILCTEFLTFVNNNGDVRVHACERVSMHACVHTCMYDTN